MCRTPRGLVCCHSRAPRHLPAEQMVTAGGRRQDWHRFRAQQVAQDSAWLLPSLWAAAMWPLARTCHSCPLRLCPRLGCGHSLLKTERRGNSCHAEAQVTHDCQESYPRSCSEHSPEFLAAAGSVRVRLRSWTVGSSQKPSRDPACGGLPRCHVLQLDPQPQAANPEATRQ